MRHRIGLRSVRARAFAQVVEDFACGIAPRQTRHTATGVTAGTA